MRDCRADAPPMTPAAFILTGMATPDDPVTSNDETVNAAVDAALANAALENIYLDPDEQALIRARQRGENNHAEYLRQAQALATPNRETDQ